MQKNCTQSTFPHQKVTKTQLFCKKEMSNADTKALLIGVVWGCLGIAYGINAHNRIQAFA